MSYSNNKNSLYSPRSSHESQAATRLLTDLAPISIRQKGCNKWQLLVYATIIVQFLALVMCITYLRRVVDPTLAIWCRFDSFPTFKHSLLTPKTYTAPAQDLVSYETTTSTPYFVNRSPYLGTDTQRVDRLWTELYDGKVT